MKIRTALSPLLTLSVLFLSGCHHPPGRALASGVDRGRVYASHSGTIGSVLVAPGQIVKTGDLLCEIEPGQAETQAPSALNDSGEKNLDRLTQTVLSSLKLAGDVQKVEGSDTITQAYLIALEVIVHNLGNVNTVGYKRCSLHFEEIAQQMMAPFESARDGEGGLSALARDQGSKLAYFSRVFTMGDLIQTGDRLDLAIQGDGLLEIQMPDGTFAYTRDGSLRTAADGHITTANGLTVCGGFQPPPSGTVSVEITPNGLVYYQTVEGKTCYQVQICQFSNPGGLEPIGRNLFRATAESGPRVYCRPGERGTGELRQGFLEASNVRAEDELVDLIRLERSYLAYSKAAKMASQVRAQIEPR